MKTNKLITLLAAIALIIIWGCEKDELTSIDNNQQVSTRDPGNGNGNKGGPKGKVLGPWGVPDGLLHVYGIGPSEAAAQSFPCEFKKARKITSIWARLARTGNPTDAYYMTLRTALDGTILGQSVNVSVAGVISEDEIQASGEWVEFPLQTPVPLIAGDYFVQMERTGPGDYYNYINWFTDWMDPLPNHAGWIRYYDDYLQETVWEMYDPGLSDEFLIMLSYK